MKRLLAKYPLPCLVFALLTACTADSAEATAPAPPPDSNAAIIRNPVAPVGQGMEEDTVTAARITFEEPEFLFGEVDEGTVVEHDFPFTNTGKTPLIITRAHATCGCTVPSYPEQPIAPGEGGVVTVSFATKNKYGRQRKPITLVANTYPSTSTIYLDGTIINE